MTGTIETQKSDNFLFLCASLSDQLERRKLFSKCFSDPLLYRFVDSVDGRSWTESKADEYVSKQMKQLREEEKLKGRHWITPAAVACAITHRDGLLAVAQKQELILCEDDVQLSSDFIEQWQNEGTRAKFGSLEGIVLLHYSSRSNIVAARDPAIRFGKYTVHRLLSSHIASGACYFAHPKTAKAISTFQSPISTTADDWKSMADAGAIPSIYLVHPSPCKISAMASTIGYGRSQNGNTPILKFARTLNRFLNKHRMQIRNSISVFKND